MGTQTHLWEYFVGQVVYRNRKHCTIFPHTHSLRELPQHLWIAACVSFPLAHHKHRLFIAQNFSNGLFTNPSVIHFDYKVHNS